MTTCNVCNGPMRVLLFSWYCPNDCDRKSGDQGAGYQVVERCDGKKWRVKAVCAGEVIPEWATRLWWAPYGDFSPDHILDAIYELDRAYGMNWGFAKTSKVDLEGDQDKDFFWMLAVAPDD